MYGDRPGAGEALARVLFAALLWWLVTLAGDVMYGLGLWPIGALLRIVALVLLGGAVLAFFQLVSALFRR
jgi:hypothetical protein